MVQRTLDYAFLISVSVGLHFAVALLKVVRRPKVLIGPRPEEGPQAAFPG
jgi:hypothetical protein